MVGIVYIQDIRYCPYLERYTSPLRASATPFELIWWERWDAKPDTPLPEAARGASACHIFSKPSDMAQSPIRKIGDFAAFARFARAIIRKKKYEKLIVLTTMSGILLRELLTGAYRNRYIFDIRDYSYERFAPFRSMEARVIDRSAFTCISSEGFTEFLPKGREYVVADNFVDADIEAAKGMTFRKKAKGEPLVISYIGFIRYFEENRKILDRLAGDSRFRLCYHGAGADYDKLVAYQAERRCPGLEVTGYFDYQRDKRALCEQADIINNFYPRSLEIQRLATTNKTYDGMIFRRPQLVSNGTFSQILIERWRIGCALDVNQPDFAQGILTYYDGIDEATFNRDAEDALSAVRKRDARYRERIAAFLNA